MDTYFEFRQDSVSPVLGIADKTFARRYRYDINRNNTMADGARDVGVYEWQSDKR